MDAAAMQQQGERREGPRLERTWTAAYDFRVAQTQKARELCRRGPSLLAVLAVVAISEAAQPRAQPAGRELCSKRQIRIPCQVRFAEAHTSPSPAWQLPPNLKRIKPCSSR